MISVNNILAAMQFDFFNTLDPIHTTKGGRRIITYQYSGTSEPGDIPGSGAGLSGYTSFTNAEKKKFEKALKHFESYLNVKFVEVTGDPDPDLNVSKVTIPGSTVGLGGPSISFSGSTITRYDGFVHYDNTLDLSEKAQFNLLLHELGHALGLDHPFEGTVLPAKFENNKYTVMSYTDNPDTGDTNDGLGVFDVLALQDIWGKAKVKKKNDTYTGPRNKDVDTVHDFKGNDTFKADKADGKVKLDLREGKFSSFGGRDDVAIAYGTKIENAVGGKKSDKIIGNKLKNKLDGKGGADNIKGGGNKDKIFGRDGNDTVNGQGGKDTLIFKKGDDKDTVKGFQDDTDTLKIIGHGSKKKVMNKAKNVGDDVKFDFANGDSILVENMTKAEIRDDILV